MGSVSLTRRGALAGAALPRVSFAPAEPVKWGSDWLHPTEMPDDKPDDARLFDLLAAWAGGEATFERILVDNPEQAYGFPPVKT